MYIYTLLHISYAKINSKTLKNYWVWGKRDKALYSDFVMLTVFLEKTTKYNPLLSY
jgi:hypothetical protein